MGCTIDWLLKIVPNRPFTAKTLEIMRVRLGEIRCILIDEISMMGIEGLGTVDYHLRQAPEDEEKKKLFFGGYHIILLGDFFQVVKKRYRNKSNSISFFLLAATTRAEDSNLQIDCGLCKQQECCLLYESHSWN